MKMDALFAAAFADTDLPADEIPKIDLYMDQILTLLESGLGPNKRRRTDKLITKTMVNNYTKEQLIMPVKGKKYTREQVMQLLCVLNLKQNLALGDIKCLTGQAQPGEVDFEAAYCRALALKKRIREEMPALLAQIFSEFDSPDSPEKRLALCLALSSGATFLRRVCEGIVDGVQKEQAAGG